jgi:hypothetical protein
MENIMAEKKWFKEKYLQVVPIRYATVELSSAEILALYTTSKELVAAPGSGKVIEFLSAVLFLDHGGTDYTTNGDLTIKSGSTGTSVSDTIAAADLIQKSADHYRVVQVLSADAQLDANESLVLTCGTGNPAAGNSILTVHVAYRIHDFN